MTHRETAERLVHEWWDTTHETTTAATISRRDLRSLTDRIEAALREAQYGPPTHAACGCRLNVAGDPEHTDTCPSTSAPATQPAPERLTDVELVAAMVMASGLGHEQSARALAQAQTIVNTLRARRMP